METTPVPLVKMELEDAPLESLPFVEMEDAPVELVDDMARYIFYYLFSISILSRSRWL